MTLRVHYYRARHGNFGDDLNLWLWERLIPGAWNERSQDIFLGVGTIIGNPMPAARKVVVFSSGIGYSPPPPDWGSTRWDVEAVRGPLTAQTLGLPANTVVADGALLLRHLPEFSPVAETKRFGIVFVPHHFSARFAEWAMVAEKAGIELLDPRMESWRVIHRLRTARLVLADSMHAAIIADTFRVPWVSVATSPEISTFKWLDWTMALGLQLEMRELLAPSIRIAYDAWAIRRLKLDHLLQPISAEAAIAKRRAEVAREPAWKKRIVRGGPQRVLLHPLAKSATRKIDHSRLRDSAEQLRALASESGSLSSEAVLKSKADELLERLKAVVAKYESS